MAYIHVEIDDELHRWFKSECAKRGTTMTAEVIDLLENLRAACNLADIVRDVKPDAAREGE